MNAPMLLSGQVLEANASAIVVAVLVAAIVLLIVLSRRQKPAGKDKEATLKEPERPRSLPSTKEVFAPEPKAAEKATAEAKGEETPWELMDEQELAAAQKKAAEAAEKEKKRKEADAEKAREREKKAQEKAQRESAKTSEGEVQSKAEDSQSKAEDAQKKAEDEQKKAEEKARKKAEAEARAEAARQAEARDRALKEAAEAEKARKKAEAEAEAKAKAEAKRKEAEAKAEAQKKAEEKDKPAAKEPEAPARTLKDGLGRTRKEGFIAKLTTLFAGKQIGDDLMDDVEEALFTADIGVRTADRLLEAVKTALSKKELKDPSKVWEVLRNEAQKILEGAVGKPIGTPQPGEPLVTMVLGVNGTGKTTSIGKLAHKLVHEERKVLLVAGDTFRAAAAEQLDHWARRVGVPCVKGKDGADPASVVYDGVKQGLDEKVEFVLVDTAGRLHNNVNLMEELKKVRRVMGRAIPTAPHEVLMVLDATTGQNGIQQAKLFKDATDVTGIILTKLDGTAKGGVVLGVCDELKIPIKWVGVGERVADLRPFDPKEFVDELFAPPS